MCILMVTAMRVNGKMMPNMARVNIIMMTEACMRVNGKMTRGL